MFIYKMKMVEIDIYYFPSPKYLPCYYMSGSLRGEEQMFLGEEEVEIEFLYCHYYREKRC